MAARDELIYLLQDMEFLVDDVGRRVAAFGRAAGLAGAAVGMYMSPTSAPVHISPLSLSVCVCPSLHKTNMLLLSFF